MNKNHHLDDLEKMDIVLNTEIKSLKNKLVVVVCKKSSIGAFFVYLKENIAERSLSFCFLLLD